MVAKPTPRNTKKNKPGIYFRSHSFKLLLSKVRKSHDNKSVLIE